MMIGIGIHRKVSSVRGIRSLVYDWTDVQRNRRTMAPDTHRWRWIAIRLWGSRSLIPCNVLVGARVGSKYLECVVEVCKVLK